MTDRVSTWQIELESNIEAEFQAVVARAMYARSGGDHEGDLICELLPRAGVDDEIYRRRATAVAVEFSQQLKT
jgi:hypothetical protein